jgi:hypothetical protein
MLKRTRTGPTPEPESKKRRLVDVEAPEPPEKPKPAEKNEVELHALAASAPDVTYVHAGSPPALSFSFSLDRGGFVIEGSKCAVLRGLLFWPRERPNGISFAVAFPQSWVERYAWILNADADLKMAIETMHIADTLVAEKMRTSENLPGVRLLNFFADAKAAPFVLETSGEIRTWKESVEIQHGAQVDVVVKPGKNCSRSTLKGPQGEILLSWPLFVQGITIVRKPDPELDECKNDTSRPMIFADPND